MCLPLLPGFFAFDLLALTAFAPVPPLVFKVPVSLNLATTIPTHKRGCVPDREGLDATPLLYDFDM